MKRRTGTRRLRMRDGGVHPVSSGMAMAAGETDRKSALRDFIQTYIRILAWIMAGLGLCLIVSLQFKWVGLVWFPDRHLAQDASAVEIRGPKILFSKESFAVDPAMAYQLSADVRVLPKADGSPQLSVVYLGVQTFDANGRELKSGPGTYRYAGASNRTVGSQENWVHVSGLIAGEGDSNHHQFRPGTRSVRLVLLANYRSDSDAALLIRNVEFSQSVTFAP
jgi:hypothetical protein